MIPPNDPRKTQASLQRVERRGNNGANEKKLLEPFDRNKTIEELIQEIEDVQMFLMAIPSADRKLPKITLIDYAIMKLKTAGI